MVSRASLDCWCPGCTGHLVTQYTAGDTCCSPQISEMTEDAPLHWSLEAQCQEAGRMQWPGSAGNALWATGSMFVAAKGVITPRLQSVCETPVWWHGPVRDGGVSHLSQIAWRCGEQNMVS